VGSELWKIGRKEERMKEERKEAGKEGRCVDGE
jgi:hypothetical protein